MDPPDTQSGAEFGVRTGIPGRGLPGTRSDTPLGPLPDLISLDLLLGVGELGSISAAARSRAMTQPAASMRLRSLESVFKVPLLDRTKAGATLTPSGTAVAQWAAVVMNEMHSLLRGVAALRAERGSELRIAASLTVAEYLIPAWLSSLALEFPETRASLTMGNTRRVVELVDSGSADLGFVEGYQTPRHLSSKKLIEDELLVLVGRVHPWSKRKRALTPQELAMTPLVLREPGSGTRDILEHGLASFGLAPTPAMELGSTTAIKSAVINGAGPGVMSELVVAGEISAGLLSAVPCEGLDLSRYFHAVWAKGKKLPPPAAFLAEVASKYDRKVN